MSLFEKLATSGWHTDLINSQEADSGWNGILKISKKKKKDKGKKEEEFHRKLKGNLGDRTQQVSLDHGRNNWPEQASPY